MPADVETSPPSDGDGDRTPPPTGTDRRWLLGVVLAGLAILGALELIEPLHFLRDDNAAYHLPAYVHSYRALVTEGTLAQLNLHQSNGHAHLAVGQTAALYPVPYLAVAVASALGDVRWAIELDVAFHLLLGLGALFLLLRHLAIAPPAAAAAALVWMTSPFVVSMSRGWIIIAHGGAWAALGILLLVRLIDRPTWGHAVALACAKTAFFFTGYPQLLFEASLFEGLLLLAWWAVDPGSRRRAPRVAGRLVQALGVTLCLSAPLLLPMFAQAGVSARGWEGVTYEDFVNNSVDLGHFLRAQIFLFQADEIARASSVLYFVGLPLLLVAALGGIVGATRIRAFALLAVVAFASSTHLWGVLYGVPLISSFRGPFKHLQIAFLFLAPVVGCGLHWLWSRHRRLACAAAGVILGIQILLVAAPSTRTAVGPITLPRPVDEHRTEPLLAEADADARFATFRRLGSRAWAPELLTHDWATLFALRHVSGYEPLRSRAAHESSFSTDFATFNVVPGSLGPDLFRSLGAWGVANILAPTDQGMRAALQNTGAVRIVASNGGIDLYRNLFARPIIEDLARGEAVAAHWSTNGLHFVHDGPGTAIRIAVTPLRGWDLRIDGESLGPPDAHPEAGLVVGLPPGRHEVALRYRTPGFPAGLFLGLVGLTLVSSTLWTRSRRATVLALEAPTSPLRGRGAQA